MKEKTRQFKPQNALLGLPGCRLCVSNNTTHSNTRPLMMLTCHELTALLLFVFSCPVLLLRSGWRDVVSLPDDSRFHTAVQLFADIFTVHTLHFAKSLKSLNIKEIRKKNMGKNNHLSFMINMRLVTIVDQIICVT